MNIAANIPMTNFPVGAQGLAIPSLLQQQNQNQAFLQPNFRASTPARPGTPHLNFGSMGTPRSISPARSASQAHRRLDQSLQSRIEASRLNIENIGRMMDIMATNVNADGSQAHQITALSMAQLQAHNSTMMRELEAIGREINAIVTSIPSATNLPDFIQAQQNFMRTCALARDISNRIMAMSDSGTRGLTQSDQQQMASQQNQLQTAPQQIQAQPVPPHAPARTHIQQVLWQPNLQPTPTQSLTSDPLRTVQDIPLTATNNELRLLTNPAGQPQALLIGPTGRYATPPLPPDIAYALLATQLPHEQLVQVFTNIMSETMNLMSGIRNAAATPTTAEEASPPRNTVTIPPQSNTNQAPPPPVAPPQAQAQDPIDAIAAFMAAQPLPAAGPVQQPPAAAPPGPRQNAAPPNNRPPDEMRDILAPYVRMIWLLIRVGVIIYLFTAGGRPSWRLILLGLVVAVVWGVQMGFFGRGGGGGVELVRRYFEQLFGVGEERERIIGEGRRGLGPNRRLSSSGGGRGSAEAASGSASSSSATATTAAATAERGRGPTPPSPRETATRLVAERETRNRDWFARRVREVERTVALFVASLWPGVGENVVRVQEQRRREEERVREEEERKRREEEEKKSHGEDNGFDASPAEIVGVDAVGGSAGEGNTSGADVRAVDGLSRVNKGKGRATEDEVAAQEVGASSGSASEMMKNDGSKEA